ncbi:glycine--tRNA ligase subunit alpha [Klebsiella pneumoniae]|nr:glycine--tRNA ligase subunit alpha [Klebsiella pneumoniae]
MNPDLTDYWARQGMPPCSQPHWTSEVGAPAPLTLTPACCAFGPEPDGDRLSTSSSRSSNRWRYAKTRTFYRHYYQFQGGVLNPLRTTSVSLFTRRRVKSCGMAPLSTTFACRRQLSTHPTLGRLGLGWEVWAQTA